MSLDVIPHAERSRSLSADHVAAHTLRRWLAEHERIFVLTGAGISTGSGIPDYRGPDGLWKRTAPITYQAFMRDPSMRARYWARSFVGWPVVASARPNPAHAALVALETQGRLTTLVTQNVDGLHTRAGHRDVLDLHGRIDQVICMQCASRVARADIQQRLGEDNPAWLALSATTAPDGDADLDRSHFDDCRIPSCTHCGGVLKPDVVFFGENVPRDRVERTQAALAAADAMLVVGSSLMVYSGFRFARMAHDRGMPLGVLTRGVTRADAIATLKLDADCGYALTRAIAK